MKYVFIAIIIIVAFYLYLLSKIVRYNLKSQQYLMEIDKDIDRLFINLELFIKLPIDKKYIKILSDYLVVKLTTINQRNQFIDSVFNDINDAFGSKDLDLTNFEVSNLNNELSNIHGDINNQIDKYNYYVEKYNKLINMKLVSLITKIFNCKKKVLFKR